MLNNECNCSQFEYSITANTAFHDSISFWHLFVLRLSTAPSRIAPRLTLSLSHAPQISGGLWTAPGSGPPLFVYLLPYFFPINGVSAELTLQDCKTRYNYRDSLLFLLPFALCLFRIVGRGTSGTSLTCPLAQFLTFILINFIDHAKVFFSRGA